MKRMFPCSFLLKMITDRVDAILTRELVREGITATQGRALGYLMSTSGHRASQRDIERHLGISHTTAKGIVQRLEGNGWVSTAFDHADGRLKIVYPTEKSISMHREVEKRLESLENTLLDGLSADERTTLECMLNRLYENIQTSKEDKN